MITYRELYKDCYRIRYFEQIVEDGFSKGIMRGTTHGCTGQEIIPVLLMNLIDFENDYIVGTHRCHGQVLAYTKDPYKLFCEMMGRKDGFVEGMGGSQHIKIGKYITNGITGGMTVIGTGIAMSLKKQNRKGIVISFMGDGGFNEGYVQETMNLASYFEVPILFVCENNHYAMSTPTEKYSAGTFKDRVKALNINYIETTTHDIEELASDLETGFYYVKNNKKPCFINISTARLCGHSKSDKMEYMSDSEKENNIKFDPLKQMMVQMSKNEINEINRMIGDEVQDAFNRAKYCKEKEWED